MLPLKPLSLAKSRLHAVAGELRAGLALAFAQDTVAAALRCPAVGGVMVVTDDPQARQALRALGATVVPDLPGSGLNAALAHGEARTRAARPDAPVAALNADLPALRPEELERVLEAAARWPRAFLADAAGVGTTLLAARPGVALRPAFGEGSRAGHRASGAVDLALEGGTRDGSRRDPARAGAGHRGPALGGVGSVRQDVDTAEDLRAALRLGVGPRTREAASGLEEFAAPLAAPLPASLAADRAATGTDGAGE
ncbi:2-phospho-L-lactate guanylyltransferase [Wenjunlia tyrosinilytica]|uniref:2-phospho-L-lactate guanylyltransferase n=1 Tax=Wenjunlia tyrosinilytica TaxID=1544741 RepID=A0A918E091_9ACTN|nr:2-phospho-L-lactate guanylyltransferase [Wenjunlia tyrosinilytica]